VAQVETTNKKINAFQLSTLGFMLGNSLFVGFGIIIMITKSKQDVWITMLMASLLAIIPIIILTRMMNYLPDKNLFEKNLVLFGKIGGNIVNSILILFILFIVTLTLWTGTYFSLTQYLTEVPYLFVSLVFILTATYAVIKGIETIARTNEIIFFVAIFLIAIVWLGLWPKFQLNEIKPILANGIKPLITDALVAISYAFPPLLTLTIIPKNDIVNNKKCYRYLGIGFVLSLIYMAITFFLIIGVISINLAELFRYPAYFAKYKIDIAGFFQGVENFLSLHWLLNVFVTLMMGMYTIKHYIKDTFKIKKNKILKIITLVLALLIAYVSGQIFKNSVTGVEFMANTYPFYVAIPLFAILIVTAIITYIHQHRQKKQAINKQPATQSQYLPVVVKE
jgi:spore germination protein KB